MKRALLLAGVFLACAAAGCGDKKGVDRTDPKSVARAYLLAIRDGDVVTAADYVLPEHREAFKKDFRLEDVPKIPDRLLFSVRTKQTKKRKWADVKVLTAKKLSLDMECVNGQWWVRK